MFLSHLPINLRISSSILFCVKIFQHINFTSRHMLCYMIKASRYIFVCIMNANIYNFVVSYLHMYYILNYIHYYILLIQIHVYLL